MYNSLGELIGVIKEGYYDRGLHSIEFNGSMLSSGVYFYSLENGKNRSFGKMIMVK
jgi:hypothetical protein